MMLFEAGKSKLVANIGNLSVIKIKETADPFIHILSMITEKKTSGGEGNGNRRKQPPVYVRMDTEPTFLAQDDEKPEDAARRGLSPKNEYGAQFWKVVSAKDSRRFSGIFMFRDTKVSIKLLDALMIKYSLSWFWLSVNRPKANVMNLSLKLETGTDSKKNAHHLCELYDQDDPKSCVATALPSVCVSAHIQNINSAMEGEKRIPNAGVDLQSKATKSLGSHEKSLRIDKVGFRDNNMCEIKGNVAIGLIHLRVTAEDLFNLLKSDSKLNAKIQTNLSRLGKLFFKDAPYSPQKSYQSPKENRAENSVTKTTVRKKTMYEISFALYLQGVQCDLSSKYGQRDSNYVLSLDTGKQKLTVKYEHNLHILESSVQSHRLQVDSQSIETGDRQYEKRSNRGDDPSLESKALTIDTWDSAEFRRQQHNRLTVELGFEGLQATLRREHSLSRKSAGKARTVGYSIDDNGNIRATTSSQSFTFEDTLRMKSSLHIIGLYDSRRRYALLEVETVDTIVTVGDNVFSTYKLLVFHLAEIQKKFLQNLRNFKFEVDERIKKTFQKIQKKRGAELDKALNKHSRQSETEVRFSIVSPRVCILLGRENEDYSSNAHSLSICTAGLETLQLHVNHKPEQENELGLVVNSQSMTGELAISDLSLRFVKSMVYMSDGKARGVPNFTSRAYDIIRSNKALPLAVFHDLQLSDRLKLEKGSTNWFMIRSVQFSIEGSTKSEFHLALLGRATGLDLVVDPTLSVMLLYARRFSKRIFEKVDLSNVERKIDEEKGGGDPLPGSLDGETWDMKSRSTEVKSPTRPGTAKDFNSDGGGLSPVLEKLSPEKKVKTKKKSFIKIDVHFGMEKGNCYLLKDTRRLQKSRILREGVLYWLLRQRVDESKSLKRSQHLVQTFFQLPELQVVSQLESRTIGTARHQKGFCLLDIWIPDNISFGLELLEFWRKYRANVRRFEEDAAAVPEEDCVEDLLQDHQSEAPRTLLFDVHVVVHQFKARFYGTAENDKDGVCVITGVERLFIFLNVEKRRGKHAPGPMSSEGLKLNNKFVISTMASATVESALFQIRMNRESLYTIKFRINKIIGNYASASLNKRPMNMYRMLVHDIIVDVHLDEQLLGSLLHLQQTLQGEEQEFGRQKESHEGIRFNEQDKKPASSNDLQTFVVYINEIKMEVKVHELSDKNGFRVKTINAVYISKPNPSGSMTTSLFAGCRGLEGDATVQNIILNRKNPTGQSQVDIHVDFTGFDVELRSTCESTSSYGDVTPLAVSQAVDEFAPHDDDSQAVLGDSERQVAKRLDVHLRIKTFEFKIEFGTDILFELRPFSLKHGHLRLADGSKVGYLHLEKVVRSRRPYRKCKIRMKEGLFVLLKMGAEEHFGIMQSSFSNFYARALANISKHQTRKPSRLYSLPEHSGESKVPRTSQVVTADHFANGIAPVETLEVELSKVELHLRAGEMIMEIIAKSFGLQLEEEQDVLEGMPKMVKNFVMWVGARSDLKTCSPRSPKINHFLINRRLDFKNVIQRRNCVTVPGFYVKLKAEEDTATPSYMIVNVRVNKCNIYFDSAIIVSNLNDIRYLVGEFSKIDISNVDTSRSENVPKREYKITSIEHFYFKPNYQGGGGLIDVDLFNVLGRIKYVTGMDLGLGSSDGKELIVPLIYNNGVVTLGLGIEKTRKMINLLERTLR